MKPGSSQLLRTLLIEPFGGLAGDMLLAALVDLGQPAFGLDSLVDLAERLIPNEARLTLREVQRGAFRGRHLSLVTPQTEAAPPRRLADLLALLEGAELPSAVTERAGAVLTRLAQAEAEVHGTSVEGVHFHEVGAVDTLIDVAGCALALERLGIEQVVASPPYVGAGRVTGAHGIMPVPAPGTAILLRGLPHRLGAHQEGGGGERLTPTGAALLAVLVDRFLTGEDLDFCALALGMGAGTRNPTRGPANLVRVQLGRSPAPRAADGGPSGTDVGEVWLLEVNLDDTTPEEIGFLLARLREAGALEAWSQALQMKKDRPGVLISALARTSMRDALERVCFRNTATLGVRWSPRVRTELPREILEVDLASALGMDRAPVRVVHRLWGGEERPAGAALTSLDLSPEFDDLAHLATRSGRALRELEALALEAARKLIP